MKRILIVSPNFPPVNAPDMQRVRMSLPHMRAFGWEPWVLAVAGSDGRLVEPDLLKSVPADIPVTRVDPLPAGLTRWIGIRNPALRALGRMYRAGLRVIQARKIDLVFFSTTMFPTMALGRRWKARTGVPFVVDMQDPWVSDYLDAHPEARPRKYAWARQLHRMLEPFTMQAVDGVMAVSPAYATSLRRRYPRITEAMCRTIPFGASEDDARVAASLDWQNPWFQADNGEVHLVSVGRGGRDLELAATILFRALRLATKAASSPRVRVWCLGTDYAPAGQGVTTLTPVAEREGLGGSTVEVPERVPYFTALRVMQDAHVVLVLGSDDAGYSPSKLYPGLLAGRPLVAVLHEGSPAVPVARDAGLGPVITFQGGSALDHAVTELARALPRVWSHAAGPVRPAMRGIERFLAPSLTQEQCAFFDEVLARRP